MSTRRYQVGILAGFDGGPRKVSWSAHVFIRTIDHQYVHSVPVFGLADGSFVPDLCQELSSFIILIFILIHRDGTVPSVAVLGDSRDLAG